MTIDNQITERCDYDDEALIISRVPVYINATHAKVESIIESHDDLTQRRRKTKRPSRHIILYHQPSTTIDDVGLQLWSGAFLLADFLIHTFADVSDIVAVELGAGVGLTAIVASLLPFKRIYATDFQPSIINLLHRNIMTNAHLLSVSSSATASIYPRILDWTGHVNPRTTPLPSWTPSDQVVMSSACVYLAADCIYDDELTFHLFTTLAIIMRPSEHLYLSLEKRYNFTISQLDLVPHGYSYFSDIVAGRVIFDACGKEVRFAGRRVNFVFPVCLQYEYSSDIELWDVQISTIDSF